VLPEHYSSSESPVEDWVEDAARAAMMTARRRRLNAIDAEELRSDLWFKVLHDRERLLSQFEGRGSRQSYLNAVAERCLLDRRIRDWGKWRPSKAARRSGPVAVLLDRLTSRDGMPVDAAVETIKSRAEVSTTVVDDIVAAFKSRRRRPRPTPIDDIPELRCDSPAADAALEEKHFARRARLIRRKLEQFLDNLPEEDISLLAEHFLERRTIASIARREGRHQPRLYRRLNSLYGRLRELLLGAGVTRDDIRSIVGSARGPLDDVLRAARHGRGGHRPRLPADAAGDQTKTRRRVVGSGDQASPRQDRGRQQVHRRAAA
jgi:DNA-directed RNA polymerase specialized sigma24 family protein